MSRARCLWDSSAESGSQRLAIDHVSENPPAKLDALRLAKGAPEARDDQ